MTYKILIRSIKSNLQGTLAGIGLRPKEIYEKRVVFFYFYHHGYLEYVPVIYKF